MKNTGIFQPVILYYTFFLFIGKNVAQNTSGIFEGKNDIGNVNHKGSAVFSPSGLMVLIKNKLQRINTTIGLPTHHQTINGWCMLPSIPMSLQATTHLTKML